MRQLFALRVILAVCLSIATAGATAVVRTGPAGRERAVRVVRVGLQRPDTGEASSLLTHEENAAITHDSLVAVRETVTSDELHSELIAGRGRLATLIPPASALLGMRVLPSAKFPASALPNSPGRAPPSL